MLNRLFIGSKGQIGDTIGIMISTIVTLLILVIYVVVSAVVQVAGDQSERVFSVSGPNIGLDLNNYFFNFFSLIEKEAAGQFSGGGGNG